MEVTCSWKSSSLLRQILLLIIYNSSVNETHLNSTHHFLRWDHREGNSSAGSRGENLSGEERQLGDEERKLFYVSLATPYHEFTVDTS